MFHLARAASNHTLSTVSEHNRRDCPSRDEPSSESLKGNGNLVNGGETMFSSDEPSSMSEIMNDVSAADTDKKKRSRRRRKTKSRAQVEPFDKGGEGDHPSQPSSSKTTPPKRKTPSMYSGWRSRGKACPASMGGPTSTKQHDAPMKKRDLYFTLHCERVGIGNNSDAVARVTLVNWENEIVLDTFVQVPVPVTDFYDTGITADDINPSTNPHVECFSVVRRTVESTLLGKILIGHQIQQDLYALGLTHPSTDVRDCAYFAPFTHEAVDSVTSEKSQVARSLDDLRKEVLQKPTAPPGDASRPIQYCVTALDLYKLYRKEWEESLAAKAREHDSNLDHRPHLIPGTSSFTSPLHPSPPGTHVRNCYPLNCQHDVGIQQHEQRSRLSSDTTLEEGIFSLHCDTVRTASYDRVARVTMVNALNDLIYDAFVQITVPVLDFKQTGIIAENVSPHVNPHALRLNVVRWQVDELLRSCHLLVGYKVDQHLKALGLAYPWTQVRDTAYFKPLMHEKTDAGSGETVFLEHSLDELSLAVLRKPLVDPEGFIQSFRSCITTLELYKVYREPWEEQEAYLMRQRQQEMAEQMASRHHCVAYGTPDQVFASSMVASYTMPGIVPVPHGQSGGSAPERSNSSWFASWGRKQQHDREYQQHVASCHTADTSSAAMLSPQAFQVLKEEASIYSTFPFEDHTGSYYGESTSHLEEASTYATSMYYPPSTSSALDDISRNGTLFETFATESVASSMHEETTSVLSADLAATERSDSEVVQSFEPQAGNSPAPEGLSKNGSSSSSWFRFGSRKSRYSSPSACASMVAVEETDEPEEMVRPTSSTVPSTSNDLFQSSSNRSNNLVSDTSSCVLEHEAPVLEPQVSRAWFGFRRRSISPGPGQQSEDLHASCSPTNPTESCSDELPDGAFSSGRERVSDEGSDAVEVTLTDLEKQNELLERPSSDGPTNSSAMSPGRNSASWFGLLRSKSPTTAKDSQNALVSQDLEETFQEMLEHPGRRPDDICLVDAPSTTVIEDDWLQEVVDVDSVLSTDELPSSVDLSWLAKDRCAMSTGKSGTGLKTQSSWFGFKRSSRLAAASEAVPTDPRKIGKTTDSYADNTKYNPTRTTDAWSKEAGVRDMQPSHLGPSWYASPTLSLTPSSRDSSTSDIVENESILYDNVFTGRVRLSTESTLPTVATEERDAEDSEEYDDEFDKGMEQNFAFLEI